jgi:hypothetical protein
VVVRPLVGSGVPLSLRLLSWAAGSIIALGAATLVTTLTGWYGAGSYTKTPYLLAAIVAIIAYLAVVRRGHARTGRAAGRAAAWATSLLMLVCAARSGLVDTATASRSNWLKSELITIASFEDEFMRDSGRYTIAPPGLSTSMTHDIRLTRDGWTARATVPKLDRSCVMFVGSTPIPPAATPRRPACTMLPFRVSEQLPGVVMILIGVALAALARRIDVSRDEAEQSAQAAAAR